MWEEHLAYLAYLLQICLKVPLDTSCCERWFSLMNRLKSKYHGRMSHILIRNLMCICANGPKKLADVDVPAAIAKWQLNSTWGRYMGMWAQDMAPVIADMQLEYKRQAADQ